MHRGGPETRPFPFWGIARLLVIEAQKVRNTTYDSCTFSLLIPHDKSQLLVGRGWLGVYTGLTTGSLFYNSATPWKSPYQIRMILKPLINLCKRTRKTLKNTFFLETLIDSAGLIIFDFVFNTRWSFAIATLQQQDTK